MVQVFVALFVHLSVRPVASPSFGPSVVKFVAANSIVFWHFWAFWAYIYSFAVEYLVHGNV